MAQLLKGHLTVADYHRMVACGILSQDDRVELLDGQVIPMTPIGSPHAGCVNRLNRMLTHALGDRATIAVQNPAVLNDWSEPQPDVTVLKPRPDGYAAAHPGPGDVLLLIEVADSSLARDREVKLPLYAAAGVAEVWLVHLQANHIHLHRDPGPAGYRSGRMAQRGTTVTPLLFPDVAFSVDDILG
jgi:Uma2 family endonuclease